MSKIILGGNQVSGRKIIEQGFKPAYLTLEGALSDIFKKQINK
jgi:NAD dependent epimerase/dehydratase family enzyme